MTTTRPIPDTSPGKALWALSSMDLDAFKRFEDAIAAGRVDFIDGDREISAGIHCRLAADSHTFGSQWLEVETADGPHVIAGDCVYWYANLERLWPSGYLQGNPWNLMKTYERIRALVGNDRLRPHSRERGGPYCRIYAPVGSHETLLAYLVRRLLENGANTSFVNRIVDPAVDIAELVADPVARARSTGGSPHPRIPLPAALYPDRGNSRGLDLSDEAVLRDLELQLAAEPPR